MMTTRLVQSLGMTCTATGGCCAKGMAQPDNAKTTGNRYFMLVSWGHQLGHLCRCLLTRCICLDWPFRPLPACGFFECRCWLCIVPHFGNESVLIEETVSEEFSVIVFALIVLPVNVEKVITFADKSPVLIEETVSDE